MAALSLKKLSLCVAALASIPSLARATSSLETTIAASVAPVTIDRCAITLQKTPDGYAFSDDVDFTNLGQRTATEILFTFKIVDTIGRSVRSLSDDRLGEFAPAAAASSSQAPRATDAIPASAKIVCNVQMVRFDDGSVWNDGDGPAGTGAMFTPLPQPSPTRSWQWPDDRPTPAR